MKITEMIKSIGSKSIDKQKGIFNSEIIQINTPENIFAMRYENPLAENIYSRIAKDISLVKFKELLIKEKDGERTIDYDKQSKINQLLEVRPNPYQSPSEFKETFVYNLIKYGNGIIIPDYSTVTKQVRDENGLIYEVYNGELQHLNVVDMSSTLLGFGYKEIDGEQYILFQNKLDSEIKMYNYKDVIHVRYKPHLIHHGDKYNAPKFNNLINLIDTKILKMISEISTSGAITGFIKIDKGELGDDESQKKAKLFITNFLKKGNGIGVLDRNTSWIDVKSTNVSNVSFDDIDNFVKYMYKFYGINEKILDQTYDSSDYNAYFNSTLEPLLNSIIDEFNYKLIDDKRRKEGYVINSSRSLLIGASIKDVVELVKINTMSTMFTDNELREMMGLTSYVGGDKHEVTLNITDLSKIDASGKEGN